MSTLFDASLYPASQCIDGDLNTFCASNLLSTASDEWLSIEMPVGTPIGYVAVYNRVDALWATRMLNPYEVFLTASPGAYGASSAHSCTNGGSVSAFPAPAGGGPFMIWCGGASNLRYVTLVIRAAAAPPVRVLSPTEVKVYMRAMPPSPPPPSPPTPLPPGGAYVPAVQTQMTIAGDVSTFNQAAFIAQLAASLGVSPSDITLSVSAGSLVLNIVIRIPQTGGASRVAHDHPREGVRRRRRGRVEHEPSAAHDASVAFLNS